MTDKTEPPAEGPIKGHEEFDALYQQTMTDWPWLTPAQKIRALDSCGDVLNQWKDDSVEWKRRAKRLVATYPVLLDDSVKREDAKDFEIVQSVDQVIAATARAIDAGTFEFGTKARLSTYLKVAVNRAVRRRPVRIPTIIAERNELARFIFNGIRYGDRKEQLLRRVKEQGIEESEFETEWTFVLHNTPSRIWQQLGVWQGIQGIMPVSGIPGNVEEDVEEEDSNAWNWLIADLLWEVSAETAPKQRHRKRQWKEPFHLLFHVREVQKGPRREVEEEIQTIFLVDAKRASSLLDEFDSFVSLWRHRVTEENLDPPLVIRDRFGVTDTKSNRNWSATYWKHLLQTAEQCGWMEDKSESVPPDNTPVPVGDFRLMHVIGWDRKRGTVAFDSGGLVHRRGFNTLDGVARRQATAAFLEALATVLNSLEPLPRKSLYLRWIGGLDQYEIDYVLAPSRLYNQFGGFLDRFYRELLDGPYFQVLIDWFNGRRQVQSVPTSQILRWSDGLVSINPEALQRIPDGIREDVVSLFRCFRDALNATSIADRRKQFLILCKKLSASAFIDFESDVRSNEINRFLREKILSRLDSSQCEVLDRWLDIYQQIMTRQE